MLEVENVKPLHHIAVISWRFAITTTRGLKIFSLCFSEVGRDERLTRLNSRLRLRKNTKYDCTFHLCQRASENFSLIALSVREL
jgi:hypothetical protein